MFGLLEDLTKAAISVAVVPVAVAVDVVTLGTECTESAIINIAENIDNAIKPTNDG